MQLFKPLKPIAFASTQGEIHSVDRLKDGSLVIRKRDQSLGNNYYTYTTGNQSNIVTLLHPISVLKIDRSFVSPIDTNGKNLEIIETIITLAHKLGMDVTTEGVETKEQLAFLNKLKYEYGQGYFSRVR